MIDIAEKRLQNLEKLAYAKGLGAIAKDNLTLQCTRMEEATFPKNVSLIIAQSSLPYCNPSKIEELWEKMYDSLEVGGQIAGDLFQAEQMNEAQELSLRLQMGGWLANETLVKSMLYNSGYAIDHFSIDSNTSIQAINFIGRKITGVKPSCG